MYTDIDIKETVELANNFSFNIIDTAHLVFVTSARKRISGYAPTVNPFINCT